MISRRNGQGPAQLLHGHGTGEEAALLAAAAALGDSEHDYGRIPRSKVRCAYRGFTID